MAKYRITSIPQYKNGGELNKLQGGGNPLYQNNALNKGSLIDQKIVATEKKGMAYQATADELKRLNAQKAQEKAKQEAIKRKAANQKKRDELAKQQLIEQEFNAQINPNKTYSETLGTVAGNAGAAQTQGALDAQIGAKQEYHQKRKFVTDNYLNTNRDALVNEAARSIQNSSNLTYEQALEQAKKDEALLYTLAEKHTPTDSEHLANLANSQDFYDYKNSRNDQINSIDPNDPTHISFENTGTLEGYMQRAKDIVFNPLDAAHYAMSNEKMPYNFSEYEKMKQQTGFTDGADNNAVMGAIDFASWFHPVGLYGQGMKMIEPTAESILKVYDDPTWENVGTAAFDIGMTGLTFLGSKNPLKFLAEEKFAADAATGFRNWNPAQSGPTPPFNTGTGLLPVGVATEVRAASEAATGTTPLLNITPIGFNPKMEIEGATVYNQLLEQKRLQDIAALNTMTSELNLRVPTQGTASIGPAQTQPSVSDLDIDKLNAIETLVQEEKVFGAAPTEIIESSTTVPRKNLNDPEYVDDEVVADIIDDMRVNKMELWNTPEGKARLQKMIDNTDSLRSNLEMTPETIIERMGSLNVVNRIRVNTETKLKALGEEEAFIDELYDTGQIDKTEWMDKIMAVDEKRNIQNLLLTEIEKGTENFSGFYDPEFNRIGINPKDYNKKEIKKVTSHEFMHLLGNGRTTYLDDMLNDLDLIEDTSTQLTIPGIGGGEESKAAALFGHDRPDYLKESLDYFKTGSGGTEKVPFISEVRQAMLEDGTIKNEYDKITPDMLKKHYEKYKKNKDEKYPIRLYDIIKDDKKNFTVLSKVLDNLPIVLQALGMADALFGQEDVDTKEAGFSLLLGAITKGKGKALKAGKGLKKFLGTESGLLSNAYKLNPQAIKLSEYNRIAGPNAIADINQSGLIRAGEYGTSGRPTLFPSFGKGIPDKNNVYAQRIINQGKTPYIISTDRAMKASTLGRHGKGFTQFPIDESGNYMKSFLANEAKVYDFKPHWRKGYQEVPIELPGNFNYNSNAGNINAGNVNVGSYADQLRAQNKFLKKPLTEKEIEMYVHFKELERFDKLPKTTNKEALEVLENFKTRIKTSEGKERMKNLGIKNDKQLQQIEILEDPNTYGYYTGNENKIAMNPNLPIPELVRHEIEHGVQNAMQSQAYINEGKIIPTIKKLFTDPFDKKGMFDKIEKANTEIDNLLSGLELKKEGTPNKIWNFNVINEKPVDVSLYKPAISDKQKATDYFLTGTEGREKSAFLGEVQQYMMNVGTIPKTGYVKITPEMVKQTMINAMFDEAGRGKYLRLFNIMKPTAANYELIAKGLNKMLGLTPLIGVGLGLGAASQISQKKGGQINNYFELDIPEEDVQKYLDEGYNVKQV